MSFSSVVDLMKNTIDWEQFFTIRQVMQKSLNKPAERFLKSKIVESGLCSCSNGLLEYIDEQGRDCQFTNSPNLYLECKGNQSNWHEKYSAKFRLVNGNSPTKDYSHLPENYAQYVMFFNLSHVYIIESSPLEEYIITDNSSNIDVEVPVHKLTLLYSKTKKSNTKKLPTIEKHLTEAFKNFYAECKGI